MDNKSWFRTVIIKRLASLKLAVFVILLLAVVSAIGTIVESKYDAFAAKKLVYNTPWMLGVLVLLSLNLIAVMVDRWPWKKHHRSFVLAHIGILVLLVGSVQTAIWGLDATMLVGIGQKNRYVSDPRTQLSIWSSFDGSRYTKLFEKEVDFFLYPPQKSGVLEFPLDDGALKVLEYHPYMAGARRVVPSERAGAGEALRFRLENPRTSVNEWLVQNREGEMATYDLGPALVHLGPIPETSSNMKNEIYLQWQETKTQDGQNRFRFRQFNEQGQKVKDGEFASGDVLQTGWMGLELKVLQYFSKAESRWDFEKRERPTPATTGAVKVEFQGHPYWVAQNDVVKLFSDNAVYIVSFANVRVDLGFDIHLKNFEVGRYPGTMRAASYASLVEVDGVGEQLISMNEPLKHQGKTIYQASFQESPTGEPTGSVFSINDDPGRFLKYLGSLIISLGVVLLFYDRRARARAQLAPRSEEAV